jgi:hypothetical protein
VSDVRNIVGHDGDPDELARLQRLHELLERVGPPPELSPALASAPEPPAARVIPFPRRYRFTAAAAAAVAAAALFGVGYLVGKTPEATVERSVAMSGHGATAELDLFEMDTAGNWPMKLHVRGLAPGRYELWLTRDGKLAETCGQFVVAGGETTVPLNAPYRLKDFDGWVVVRYGMQEPLLTTV